ncbi:PTS transporter subunit EIIC [Lacticaseibacillus camelliae]|uniref:PTS transporter subunit EIIC n=1 Tax=Lacticaseibacillus camelliae TaxID=381742 RepID=UPI0021E83D96|nr:PTS transporter subunit EIIC [Lacticaseibacillus camelliae]
MTENMKQVANGQAPTHIAADGFLNFGMTIGGTGAILGLVLCMFTAKSEQYKAVRNVGFVPSLFNISEPIMFGFPVVLNTFLSVPMLLIPMILEAITWYLMKFGIIGHIVAQVPWCTPVPFLGFLMTGGDWRAGLWQLIEVAWQLQVTIHSSGRLIGRLSRRKLQSRRRRLIQKMRLVL